MAGHKKIDLTGRIFGKLSVLRLSPYRNQWGQRQWDCKCECGNFTLVTTSALVSGNQVSCRCGWMSQEQKEKIRQGMLRVWKERKQKK